MTRPEDQLRRLDCEVAGKEVSLAMDEAGRIIVFADGLAKTLDGEGFMAPASKAERLEAELLMQQLPDH